MKFHVSSSPHISTKDNIQAIMLRVIIALLPACIYSIVIFGVRMLLLFAVAIASSIGFEVIAKKLRGRKAHIEDLTSVITAMLLVMVLPPTIPIAQVVIGSAVAILFGKEVFGGLGCNIFNPALVGRAFLHISFPARITNYNAPISYPFGIGSSSSTDAVTQATGEATNVIDAFTSSTPLSFMKYTSGETPANLIERIVYESQFYPQMLLGNTLGSVGETSFVLLLIGAIFLFVTKTFEWRIPLGIFASAVIFSLIFSLINPAKFVSPIYTILSGGFVLGAFFMATDMVSSPLTKLGCFIYAIFIGIMVVILRNFSNNPEGMMYAILLGNAITPLINMYTKPQVFGQAQNLKAKQG